MTTVKGYRKLTENQISQMNILKEEEEGIMQLLDVLARDTSIDKLLLAHAKITMTGAFMWANRAVAQPKRLET